MKKYLGLLLLGVVLSAALTGCKKDEAATDTTTGTTGASATGTDTSGPSKPSTDAGTTSTTG